MRMHGLCVAVALLAVRYAWAADEAARVEVGKPAPPLGIEQFVQPEQGTAGTWDALRGKVVVLEFWATWCGPCVGAIAHLNELADKFKDRPVQFIAISDEKEATVQRFLKRKAMRAWVGLDTDHSMFTAYGVEGIPRTIVVDAKGIVVADTYPTMLDATGLEDVLAGRPPRIQTPTTRPETVSATSPEPQADGKAGPPLLQVVIRRHAKAEGAVWRSSADGCEFEGCPLNTILSHAYGVERYQLVLPEALDNDHFDVIAKTPGNGEAALPVLQQALNAALGLHMRRESRACDGYRLVLGEGGQHKLAISAMEPDAGSHSGSSSDAAGNMNYTLSNQETSGLCRALAGFLECPVFDYTGLTGRYDVLLEWKVGDNEALRKAVHDQLGLELQPTQRPVEMLIFEAAGEDSRP